ncbi:hypothetical protein JIG36_04065 [Actinoplanes sp. LDG1-06]|uniref:Alpha/beta hydrolase n=1 Tax=Paractinoplanes ovalisporus TaxID=2810368 RepID=A0ABS2A4E8_9ACTN|nr:hypothetical protein [Actinoplanes ovalisporus]MBM2614729.1 hypothetical protein [Actinoplanes ovalisporus]
MRILVEGTVERLVLLLGADDDPGPAETWARGVTLAVTDEAAVDHSGPIGVVGAWGAGLEALAFAARHPGLVDRLVLVATPIPDEVEGLKFKLSEVTAKTLLLFGAKDPDAGARHGTWWQKNLPAARLEMNPDGDHDLLTPMWKRVLSHLAPRAKR